MAIQRGVSFYTKATVEVYFPNGIVNCWNCLLFDKGRNRCVVSGESIQDPMNNGEYCRLDFAEGEDNGKLLSETE